MESDRLMEQIRINLVTLCNHLKMEHSDNEVVKILISRFDKNNIIEGHDTCLLEKTKIILCIRKYDTQILYDLNTLIFVSISMLAHLCSNTYGHTEEYQDNFKFLLEEGVKIGIYNSINYYLNPAKYCVTIYASPLYEDTIEPYIHTCHLP